MNKTLPSRTKSILAWLKHNIDDAAKNALINGVCQICSGRGEVVESKSGLIYCACTLAKMKQSIVDIQDTYGTAYYPKSMDMFSIGNDSFSEKRAELKQAITTWLKSPNGWILFYGFPGSGKTLLANIIASSLNDWSVYISATDLIAKIFSSLSGQGPTQDMIDDLKGVPFLILDDWGSGYRKSTGAETYNAAVVREILTYRYEFSDDLITVVTTNLDRSSLFSLDPRVADRLWGDKTYVFDMNFASWRATNGNIES